ncbi:MAG: XdhC family protein [Chitinophagaceae bacterium]
MDKQLKTWQFISDSLEKEIPVMLLYVLESKGSSPGRQGFFMAVNAEDKMTGSIGGGIMEHKFVEMAKEELRIMGYGLRGVRIKQQVHDKSASTNQSGMICSGEQTLLLYPVKRNDIEEVRRMVTSLQRFQNGTLQFSQNGFSFAAVVPGRDHEFIMRSEDDWIYREKTGYKNQLFIIGGGHCALAFSKLMRGMDFYITVFEERENINTLVQNHYAHEVMIVDDYSALPNLIPSGPNQYAVIMTQGYRTDDIAIRALLGKQFRYLGVLGSKSKMEKMFVDFMAEGVSSSLLERIHAPVGVQIHSQSPEEIAVSIAAEIIQEKNSG